MKARPERERTMGKKHAARRFIYKCNACRVRNSFIHSLGWYTRPKMCRNCGGLKFHTDGDAMRRRRRVPCRCDGCHYPHRRGSSVCFDNPYYGLDRFEAEGGRTDLDVPF